jgi:hypothetical protein
MVSVERIDTMGFCETITRGLRVQSEDTAGAGLAPFYKGH